MMALKTISRARQYMGLAKDSVALRCSPNEQMQQNARRHLVERMGRMRGLPQKLGQMIGFSLDDDESDAAHEFASLQDEAQPLSLDVVLPVLETEWKSSPDKILDDISADAKAASLGQVHQARLKDGRRVAIKVQYPGIRDAVMLDLKMLGWLSLPVGSLRRGFDLKRYQQVMLEGLEAELNYLTEAESQSRCARDADRNRVIVPRILPEFTTKHVLVSEWEDGEHWNQVRHQWSEPAKRKLANGLVQFFHDGLFRHGQVHADWHPGNLRFRLDGEQVQIVVYDFGCVYRPTMETRLALLRLIRATQAGNESPLPLFLKLGFDRDNLAPLADKLPALCRVLLEPYGAEYVYDANDWRLGERVSDILGNDRWNFRIAGPADLVFLLRAFFGLKYYLCGLGVGTSWSRVMQPLLAEFQSQLNSLSLPAQDETSADFSSLAKYLRTRVTENGKVKVQLSQSASAIDRLDELIDDELRRRIEKTSGQTLRQMVSSVRQRGYRPGVVFEHKEAAKEIRVWLD